MSQTKHDVRNIDLDNSEFQDILRLIRFTNQSIFMTGRAGTGKSTFLRYIADNVKKRHVILAPTGIAAVNAGGVTLHSFFRIPFKPLLPDDPEFAINRLRKRLKYPKTHAKLIKELELIIIDEISMVRADIIDFIDKVLRVYSGNMRQPFGGKQLLFVGDIFQLEPVVTADMREILRQWYANSFFFSAKVFEYFDIVPIELRKVYRQQDTAFIQLLDRFRTGNATQTDIDCLNAKVKNIDITDNKADFVMTLATRRDMVDHINESHLDNLPSKEITYMGAINGDFPDNSLPTAMELTLKPGAQIVFIRNDRERRWVNGTIAKVTVALDDRLEVEMEDGTRHDIEKEVWDNIVYGYDEKNRKVTETVIGSFTQYPVKLAWALTIHKSQGLTFNNVIIDLGRGAFSGGQTYVALSRATSLEGITLCSTVNQRDIFVNPSIIEFARRFNDTQMVNAALKNAEADDAYYRAAKAFDERDFATAVDQLVKALQSRNELNRPSLARLLRLKFASLSSDLHKVEELQQQIDRQTDTLHRLANEYVVLGNDCLDDYDDLTAAIANYDKALSIDPTNTKAMYGKARALHRTGKNKEARIILKELLHVAPRMTEASILLADIYIKSKQMIEAADVLLGAYSRDKTSVEVAKRLAKVYDSLGDENSAERYRAIAERLRRRKS